MRILVVILAILCLGMSYENIVAENVYLGTPRPVVVTMGDSITEGGTATDDFGFRKKLQVYQTVLMNLQGQYSLPASDATYSVLHSGVSGDTSAQIEARVQTNLDNYLPSGAIANKGLMFIHAGTNDGLSVQANREAARDNVEDMIDLVQAHDSDIDVYVALIIPGNHGGDANITLYNGILETMLQTYQASKSNLHIVDMNTSFKNDTFGICSGDWISNCMFDVTHPNDTGYQAMARQWYECIINKGTSLGSNCNGN